MSSSRISYIERRQKTFFNKIKIVRVLILINYSRFNLILEIFSVMGYIFLIFETARRFLNQVQKKIKTIFCNVVYNDEFGKPRNYKTKDDCRSNWSRKL